jgi:murein DD-endopeptidase MepM/ murein hydrolase activator NlpD
MFRKSTILLPIATLWIAAAAYAYGGKEDVGASAPDLNISYVIMEQLHVGRIEDSMFESMDSIYDHEDMRTGNEATELEGTPWAIAASQLEWVDDLALGNVVLPAGTRFQVIDRVIDSGTRSRYIRLKLDTGFSFWTPLEDIDFAQYIPEVQLTGGNGAFDFRISSGPGWRVHPVLKYCKLHNGIDYAAPAGTPIPARGSGTVSRAERSSSYGLVVYLNHGDGSETRYAHMSKMFVKSGQSISNGTILGMVGATGRVTGAHLHFERNRVGGASLLAMKNTCTPGGTKAARGKHKNSKAKVKKAKKRGY